VLKLLIVEGNTPDTTRAIEAFGGRRQSRLFEDLLGGIEDVTTETLFAADVAVPLPEAEALRGYDGLVWTGSALNLYDREPASERQVELMRRALNGGAFVYGSCWGLQVAVAACGGRIRPNPRGPEYGVARGITLTPAGARHSLLRGRSSGFSALSLHRDIVDPLPESVMTVLAGNDWTPVQAAELRLGDGVFWGVQYHPEYGFDDLAAAFRRYGPRLVEDRFFTDRAAMEATIRCYETAAGVDGSESGPEVSGSAFDPSLFGAPQRALEIHNWLNELRHPARPGF
jgi:GMP synthase (glutamine-hydrolysing)